MSRVLDRCVTAGGVLLGATWLLAAAAKLAKPYAAFELAVHAAPAGTPVKPFLIAAIAAEAALGTAMCLRVVRGFGASLCGVGAATVVLLAARAEGGPGLSCGCFGPLFGESLDGALARNAVLAALHVGLLVVARRGTGGPGSRAAVPTTVPST